MSYVYIGEGVWIEEGVDLEEIYKFPECGEYCKDAFCASVYCKKDCYCVTGYKCVLDKFWTVSIGENGNEYALHRRAHCEEIGKY